MGKLTRLPQRHGPRTHHYYANNTRPRKQMITTTYRQRMCNSQASTLTFADVHERFRLEACPHEWNQVSRRMRMRALGPQVHFTSLHDQELLTLGLTPSHTTFHTVELFGGSRADHTIPDPHSRLRSLSIVEPATIGTKPCFIVGRNRARSSSTAL